MPSAAPAPTAGPAPVPATTLTIALTADQRDAIRRATRRDVQLLRISVEEIEGAVAIARPTPLLPPAAARPVPTRFPGAAIA